MNKRKASTAEVSDADSLAEVNVAEVNATGEDEVNVAEVSATGEDEVNAADETAASSEAAPSSEPEASPTGSRVGSHIDEDQARRAAEDLSIELNFSFYVGRVGGEFVVYAERDLTADEVKRVRHYLVDTGF